MPSNENTGRADPLYLHVFMASAHFLHMMTEGAKSVMYNALCDPSKAALLPKIEATLI
jgi:hypothetical protein